MLRIFWHAANKTSADLNNNLTNSILEKLATLTNERDVVALEHLLAQILYDLVSEGKSDASVAIYHPADTRKQHIPTVLIGKSIAQVNASDAFMRVLIDCFKAGKHSAYPPENGAKATLLYPVKNTKEHPIAVVAVEAQAVDAQLQEAITLLLKVYQNFIGLISDNERDTLTGLLNRKTFDYKINKILAQMQKAQESPTVASDTVRFLAIFDIDHFKRVNDEFGHLIGDEVLLLFSQLMTQTFRSSDPIFRFGGEEFVALFECASQEDIPIVLNRFREKVSDFDFPQVGKVTVSIGYTQVSKYDLASQLVDHADLALYYAKNNGRNRVCFYERLIADGDLKESKKTGDIELF